MENIASLEQAVHPRASRLKTFGREVLEMAVLVALLFAGVRLLMQNFRV